MSSGFVLVTAVLATIYRMTPRVQIHWSDVWLGALVTATLFSSGRALIGVFLGTGAVDSGFGAAASLEAVLVRVQYSAQIFLLGAEFTWACAHTAGSRRRKARELSVDAAPSYTTESAPPTAAAAGQP